MPSYIYIFIIALLLNNGGSAVKVLYSRKFLTLPMAVGKRGEKRLLFI